MDTWTEATTPQDGWPALHRVKLNFDGRTYRYRRSFTDQFKARVVMLKWRAVFPEAMGIDLTADWIPEE